MPTQLLLVFPTPDSILQRFSLIIRKKIPDLGIILKLLRYLCFPFFLLFKNLIISLYCVFVSLSPIAFQPFLKSHRKGKAVPDMLFEESPVLFGADKIRLNLHILANTDM